MTPEQFVKKWSAIGVNELAAAQSHFLDVCDLVGHPHPYDNPETQHDFRFEKPAAKPSGKKGRADAFYKGKFVWEYKGAHADLDKAYEQVLLYRDALFNPPLLIVSDTQRIIIHTNYTNTIRKQHVIELADLLKSDKLALLKSCFAHKDEIDRVFKPTRTQELVTAANANTFIAVADELKAWNKHDLAETPEKIAHFIVRILFALFAEDMELLPENLFRQTVSRALGKPDELTALLRQLFHTMRDGGWFGFFRVPHFNGDLFDDDYIPKLPGGIGKLLVEVARQDWKEIDPTIFGTLFERIIDPATRAPLGAHYTSKADILLIVEPVLMQPLRREWEALRPKTKRLAKKDPAAAHALLADFAAKIAAVKVLDPACGSGNFLYIALQALLTLQKAVIVHARRNDLPDIRLTVSPAQLYGIEINPYAHELAQITIWIGYIQWRNENGFSIVHEPILQPLNQIERKDAILAYDADGNPVEPEWPSADVIIGNPPFLGTRNRQNKLPQTYVQHIGAIYSKRIPGDSDLVCYWFEKSREQLEMGKCDVVGLLATNSIRGGLNRRVLERIKETGDIFWAWSDRDWILDGASVRVSMIGFDRGQKKQIKLNGEIVTTINSDLTSNVDITSSHRLQENFDISFQGIAKAGAFDIPQSNATRMIELDPNNAQVLRPLVNAREFVNRPRYVWIIDFQEMPMSEASTYHAPFAHVIENVRPKRQTNSERKRREKWWIHGRSRPQMREAITLLSRYIATPNVSKHRIFAWLPVQTLPDGTLYIFAREDDYFLGVLHSKLHEMWALGLGTWLGKGNDPRYTSTTTFETFPFPWSPSTEPSEEDDDRVAAVADAARELVAFRQAWLNPPAPQGAIDVAYEKRLKRRTLTNLYNALQHYRAARAAGETHTVAFKSGWKNAVRSDITIPQVIDLHDIHTALDHAVLDCYGWLHNLTDEQILERLLALNLERVGG